MNAAAFLLALKRRTRLASNPDDAAMSIIEMMWVALNAAAEWPAKSV
jgi:hypothetical protein